MSLLMVLLPVFAAGFILGCVYFPLLWLTIRHLSQSERPLRLMMVSFISRFAVAVSVFYLVMNGRMERILVALLGFVVAREICKHFFSGGLRPKRALTSSREH